MADKEGGAMKKDQRKRITVYTLLSGGRSIEDMNMDFSELKRIVLQVESETPPEALDTLQLEAETSYGYDLGDEDHYVKITRLETSIEADLRVENERRELAERKAREDEDRRLREIESEARDRREFARLKRKYGAPQ